MSIAEQIIATVILGLLLAALTFICTRAWKSINKSTAAIRLSLKEIPKDIKIKLTLRHLRDGKDEISDHGELLNLDRAFQKLWFRNEWVARTIYSKSLGFQFKCYIEFPESSLDEIYNSLGINGFIGPLIDETIRNRIWFFIPNIAT